ncbi:sulfite exporter TauE/SafE family protein [Patescibacteria group bacterium]|nr:sulfite exporter TauE/SafE family protein [Patescibacteria group bacterium]
MENFTLIILGLGIGFGFLIQTIVGFAASLIALPILLLTLNLQDSIAFLSIFHLIFSVFLISKNYKLIDKNIALEMLTGGIIGLIIGIYTLKYGNPAILKKLLGIFIVLYVGHSSLKKRKIKIFDKVGFIFTFLGGFFSGLYSTGGPLFATYIHNKLTKPSTIRATLIGTLAVVNVLRMPLLIGNDLISYNIFLQSIVILPFFLLSIYLGEKLYKKVNEVTFKRIFIILLFMSGIALIIK